MKKPHVIPSSLGRWRILTHPKTRRKVAATKIIGEIHVPADGEQPYDAGSWGKYVFGAWLEKTKAGFLISFPYWRNGRFAGQYSLRAEPYIVKRLFREMKEMGWLGK